MSHCIYNIPRTPLEISVSSQNTSTRVDCHEIGMYVHPEQTDKLSTLVKLNKLIRSTSSWAHSSLLSGDPGEAMVYQLLANQYSTVQTMLSEVPCFVYSFI